MLAIGVGFFVLMMVWSVLNKGAKSRRATLKDGEIDRAAAELIEKHGGGAAGEAVRLGAERLALGDFEGEAVWKLVAKVVAKLQSG